MSMQAVNEQALVPAAKGLYAGSGRANSLPEVKRSGETAEVEARSREKLLERHKKQSAAELPAATQLVFSPDPEHKRVFIKISDSRTGQVLLEVPPEKVARAMDQLIEMVSGSRIDFEA